VNFQPCRRRLLAPKVRVPTLLAPKIRFWFGTQVVDLNLVWGVHDVSHLILRYFRSEAPHRAFVPRGEPFLHAGGSVSLGETRTTRCSFWSRQSQFSLQESSPTLPRQNRLLRRSCPVCTRCWDSGDAARTCVGWLLYCDLYALAMTNRANLYTAICRMVASQALSARK
jgi:hypothetical protein